MCIYYKSFLSLHSSFFFHWNKFIFSWWPESSPCVAVMVLCSLGILLGLYRGHSPCTKLPQTSVFRVTASVSWGSPRLFCLLISFAVIGILSPAIILSPVTLCSFSLLIDENKVNIKKWFQNQNHWHRIPCKKAPANSVSCDTLDLLDPSSCTVVFFAELSRFLARFFRLFKPREWSGKSDTLLYHFPTGLILKLGINDVWGPRLGLLIGTTQAGSTCSSWLGPWPSWS